MASNYTQPQPFESPPLDGSLDAGTSGDLEQGIQHINHPNGGRISSDAQPAYSGRKILNEAYLIRSRRVNFNQRARKSLELLCEDKVSKYKLEEVHCSLPSSVKSTFIMTFSPDGRKVASTHGDHRIYICDLNTGKLLDTLEGHPKTPWCLAWHPSNRDILASGCLAGEVRVWDLRSKACESWTSENNTIITSLDFHPKERVIVIATANDIHFWDWSESEPFAKTTTTHDKEKVKFVEFDSSGTKLVTGISNLPKFAGYSSDSLQNRIIDSYLTQGTLDQIPSENMTQNSEIANTLSGALNSNETFNERNATQLSLNRQLVPNTTNQNEQDINYRSTLTLSRVAFLYRQLEALEDSMRHTSFSPYINPRLVSSTLDPIEGNLTGGSNQEGSEQFNNPSNNLTSNVNYNDQFDEETSPTRPAPSQARNEQQQTPQTSNDSQAIRSARAPNAFEPFVVCFDEFLEQLQLTPLVVDGFAINPAQVIEQYPIDLPYQLHYVMQCESINQVNQNFIRISKLMSSVRLYRQVVQQILSSSSGQSHYQPNQILTAQSASPRSFRHASNLPIVFRNIPIGNSIESSSLNRPTRSTDPILAIQFRNSARNVPLVTICKIDLLSARSVCIMRSQQLIEQSLPGIRPTANNGSNDSVIDSNRPAPNEQTGPSSQDVNIESNMSSFYPLLNQLHQSLSVINHAPLTTSNVHAHISSLRTLINKLLTTLASMFQSHEEGRRLVGLIHNIAHSLTSRSWDIPLGATLDDIRLDVIHTLCIVDLSLHLTRQVQLLQMQRLAAIARIEESRRTAPAREVGTSTNTTNSAQSGTSESVSSQSNDSSSNDISGPSTSRDSCSNATLTKRKSSELLATKEDTTKKRKVDTANGNTADSNYDTEMIETQNAPAVELTASPSAHSSSNSASTGQSNSFHSVLTADSLPTDRLVLWNSTHSQAVEQSLQRFLVATTSNMSNGHILVRIYHRLHDRLNNNPAPPPSSTLDNYPTERPNPPLESLRRALSQDGSTTAPSLQENNSTTIFDQGRGRQAHHGAASVSSSNGTGLESWQRHPHLHVYQTRGSGQHLWFNQWTIPLPVSNSNYRLQCWNFSLSAIPNIKDSQSNIVTQKCRIHNDASIDISSDGSLLGCLVPRDDGACLPSFDLKIFSLKTFDFGACYYQLPHGPNAISVSMSPSGGYAVVGLASNKFISNDPTDDDITIAKVFKLNGKHSHGYVRDIKIKRDDSSLSLNAIRWLERGIVYNVGPQHHQRYQATRMRNRVA